MKYKAIAYRLFGKYFKKENKKPSSLKSDLKKSRMGYSVDEYLSIVTFTTLLIGITVFSTSLLIFSFFFGIFSLVLSTIITTIITISTFLVTYLYPKQIVASMRKKIDNTIHYATIYMSTLAGTGIPPYKMFKILSEFKELGVLRTIFANIWKEIDVMGVDVIDALSAAAEFSPSDKLKDLLWGMKSTIQSGGDLKKYLEQKTKTFIALYRRNLKEYTNFLSIFMEMYITAVIVGSVFVLVLTTIMSMLGSYAQQIEAIQLILVTVGLPFISGVFILILRTMSPTEV